MSVTLQPWRDPEGNLADGVGRVWVYCPDHAALDAAKAAAPRDEELVEVEVAAPDRVRGLEARARLPFEFELVRWVGRVVDAELAKRAAAIALPKEIVDTTLGRFELRASVKWYEAKRPSIGRKRYRFVVKVGESGEPSACIEKSRPVAAWVEPQFKAIVATAAERMFDVWRGGGWGEDDDENEAIVDPKSFAKRLTIESVHWDPKKSVDDVVVGLDDDNLYGGHGIDVTIVGRKITDVRMG